MQINEEMVDVVQRFLAEKKPSGSATPGEIREMLQYVIALGWLTAPPRPACDVELSKEEDAAIHEVIAQQRRAYKTAISVLHDAKGDVQAQLLVLTDELAAAKARIAELEGQQATAPRGATSA